ALMEVLRERDNRSGAEVVARAFIERLARELGVAPSAETMRLVRTAGALAEGEPIVVLGATPVRTKNLRTTDATTNSLIAQARHHWDQRTRGSIERAISFFSRAVERDPQAVAAWYGLADAWTVMAGRAYAPAQEVATHSLASIERAMALDDSLSSVYVSLGGLNIIRRRWDAAETALRRAIELDPQNADAHH